MGSNKRATRRLASLLTTCRLEMIPSRAPLLIEQYNSSATNHRVNRRQMAYLVTEIKP